MNMSPVTKYVLVSLVAYLVTTALTPCIIRGAIKMGAIDVPGGRRKHHGDIPRGGGIAVFIGFHTGCAFVFFFNYLSPWYLRNGILDLHWWLVFLATSTILLALGIVDDIRGLPAFLKLLGQLFVSTLMFLLGVRFGGVLGYNFPDALDYCMTMLWFLGLINAFNLIDGFDGVASGIAAIAGLGLGGTFLFRHLPLEALMICALIASLVAFLRFNFHPAKVFLGDSGSMFLGFTLASFSLATASKGTALASLWVPILGFGVPIFDTFIAIWRRSAKQAVAYLVKSQTLGGIMTGDSDHVHHRLVQLGITPRNVTASIYLATSVLVLTGMVSLLFRDKALGLFACLFALASFVITKHLLSTELRDSGFVVVHAFRDSRRPALTGIIYIVLDASALALAAFAVPLLSSHFLPQPKTLPLALSPWWCFLPLICLFGVEPYRLIWTRQLSSARTQKVLSLASWCFLLLGTILLNRSGYPHPAASGALFTGLSLIFVASIRMVPRLVEELMVSKGFIIQESKKSDQCHQSSQ